MKTKFLKLLSLFFLNFVFLFAEKPYVLLISIDGFRWDYLNRGVTPNLKNFAHEGVQSISLRPVFPTSTFPNHYSIITGLYSENHNITNNRLEDPFSGQIFSLKDTTQVRNAQWYLGEAFWETARRNGIITASFFWPGSEINIEYRRPNFFKHYNNKVPHEVRIKQVIEWLKLPPYSRPHFITLYFELIDNLGHTFGPNSHEVDSGLALIDKDFAEIITNLAKINFLDSINIIVVSDHGMTEIDTSKIIDLSKFLDDYQINIDAEGYIAQLSGQKASLDSIYIKLKQLEKNFKVYKREELPKHYHYANNPYIKEILIIPEQGWNVVRDRNSYIYKVKGNHGYDNNWIDMHGIFLAKGPVFKTNYKTGTLWNIDIYPLLCKIFQIPGRAPIDGNLERIEFVLK